MMIKASHMVASETLLSHHRVARPVAWADHFPAAQPLDVEIGFGLGEFLIRLSQENPDRNFVGIEHDWQRVNKALYKLDRARERSLPAAVPSNLRLLHVDAWVAFQRLFVPKSIQRIFSLFPCPWPKKKHSKHRLFSRDFLKLINSRLIDGGVVKIVTDHEPYVHWALEEIPETGFSVKRSVVKPQFDTKFERKWREAGQHEFFAIELTKEEHMPVAVQEDCELKVYFIDRFDAERFQFSDVIADPESMERVPSIIMKDFIFDPKKKKGMIHLVVAEATITQHVWLVLIETSGRWCLAVSIGQMVLPTLGVAQAMEAVYQAVLKSTADNRG